MRRKKSTEQGQAYARMPHVKVVWAKDIDYEKSFINHSSSDHERAVQYPASNQGALHDALTAKKRGLSGTRAW